MLEKDRKKEIERLRNESLGMKIKSQWLSSMSLVCGIKFIENELLSLEETKNLKDNVIQLLKDKELTKKIFWNGNDFEKVNSYVLDVALSKGSAEVILFSSVDKNVGALKLQSHHVFRHVKEIWDIVGEDLCVATLDAKSGLCLEYNYYNEKGEYDPLGFFEVSIWGLFAQA